MIRDISDTCQENFAMSMLFKFPIEQIICNCTGADRPCYPAVGICLADRAIQAVFVHETMDFLHIHYHGIGKMEQLHVNTADASSIFLICMTAVLSPM